MIVLAFDPGATIGWAAICERSFIRGGSTRDLGEALAQIQRWSDNFAEYDKSGASLVAVESVSRVYPRERFSATMATALLLAERQAGELVATARSCGFDVLEVSAAQWRRKLFGSGKASDKTIAQLLPRVVSNLPTRTNAHVRDAVGLAAYAEKWARVQERKRG